MKRVLFYLNYAYQNIRRGGRWSALAIFCIAAGVATVVALRSLGLGIGDSLIGSVRTDNKGDIRLFKPNRGESFGQFFAFGEEAPAFSAAELDNVAAWVAERGGRTTAFTRGGSLQVAKLGADGVESPQSVTILIIDPATYPVTGSIRTQQPADAPLAAVFTEGNDIVISANLAQQQNIAVGDVVRVGGTTAEFTVRAIVDAAYEAGVQNIFSSFFGFAYIDLADARQTLGEGIDPNTIGIVFDAPPTGQALVDAAEVLDDIASRDSGATRYSTVEQSLRNREAVAQIIGDFIVVLGLGALLIGGVGILNTMLVMVRRRTIEIAALKTFGLKGRQVAWLFLAEGLLLGLVGSIIGSLLGLLLSGIVNRYGETFLQQQIVWRLYPEALLYGFALGMVTTVIFGLAPIMTALTVRPGIILRPNDNHIPTTGLLQTLLLLVIVTLLIGLVVGQIISPSFGLSSRFDASAPYLTGIVGVAATLLLLGVLVLLLWVIVWLVGKLPSFGSVTLRLALRNLSTNRIRTATTLLALCAGMFALSSITFVGEGTRQLLNLQLSQQFGGNVLVFPLAPGSLGTSVGEFAINNALMGLPGISGRTTIASYEVRLVAVDGVRLAESPPPPPPQTGTAGRPRRPAMTLDEATLARTAWENLLIWDSTRTDFEPAAVIAGRTFTPADRGQRYVIGSEGSAATLGIGVGSVV
ncbi:MAG: ABC transporter permease, partial [Anaerolineae bacterium]|nr:ABC transporter permease [Anaerolineae bacterium]